MASRVDADLLTINEIFFPFETLLANRGVGAHIEFEKPDQQARNKKNFCQWPNLSEAGCAPESHIDTRSTTNIGNFLHVCWLCCLLCLGAKLSHDSSEIWWEFVMRWSFDRPIYKKPSLMWKIVRWAPLCNVKIIQLEFSRVKWLFTLFRRESIAGGFRNLFIFTLSAHRNCSEFFRLSKLALCKIQRIYD